MRQVKDYGPDLTIFDPADTLRDHPRLLVRRVLTRDDALTDALLDLAAGKRKQWTPEQWNALLAELSKCDDTLEDWLVLNS